MDSNDVGQSEVPEPREKEEKRKKPKVEWEPEIFNPLGIFENGDGFLCLICNRYLKVPGGCKGHSNGKEHRAKYSLIKDSHYKIGGLCVCKLCSDYAELEWKKYLIHFQERNHLADFNSVEQRAAEIDMKKEKFQNSRFSYVILETCQIIEHETGIYFCCCCGTIITGWESLFRHINEKEHREKQEGGAYDYDGDNPEGEAQKLVTNFLSHVSTTLYYCYLCERSICGRKNCHEHINGAEHKRLKETACNGNEKQPLIDYRPLSAKLKPATENSTTTTAEDESVADPNNGKCGCQLCGGTRLDVTRIMKYVSGIQNKKKIEQACGKTQSDTESEELSGSSSSSCVSKSSYSWESCNGESESLKSSEDSSKSWENLDSVSLGSWEKIDIPTFVEDYRRGRPFGVPEHFVPLIEKNLLQQQSKEYFCAACKAHLRDLRSLVDHTSTKKHFSALRRFRAKAENRKLSATSESTSSTASSSLNPPIGKPSLPVTESQNDHELTDAPKNKTIPIPLEPDLLKHFEDDILCLACNVHFTNVKDYMIHIKSESHRATLDEYRTDKTGSTARSSMKKNAMNSLLFTQTTEESAESITNISEHFEDDILCLACNVHFTHVDKYFEHISSESHQATLDKYRTGLVAESTAETCQQYIPTNSVIASGEKTTTSNTRNIATTKETTNPQNPQSSLMYLPTNILPLIAKHSLKHLEKKVYCPACKVQMTDPASVVSHTNSHKHNAKLKLVQGEASSGNAENLEVLHISVAQALRDLELVKQTLTGKSNPKLRIKRMASLRQKISALENSVNKLTIAEVRTENSAMAQKKLLQNNSQCSKMDRRTSWKQSQRQNNSQMRGRGFDPRVDMKHIYNQDPEKLRILKLSCQLSFPKASDEIYCLVCERSISNEVQKFYEHLMNNAHVQHLTVMEQNNKHFIFYPEQHSDLSLAKEFIQQTSVEETLQCLACDTLLKNDDAVISEHIQQDPHKERKQAWNLTMEESILQEMLAKIERTWYNIQKYWCQPCGVIFNTEFHFAEHIDTRKHNQTLTRKGVSRNRLIYDACIPCATIWLGSANVYSDHCDQPMHKYLLQTGDYSVCTLPGQVKDLLEKSEAEVDELIKLSDLNDYPITLLKCLEDTVKPQFPRAKAYPFGSRVSGLGFPDSDIDVFLDCGTYSGAKNTKELEMEIFESVENCFFNNQQSWEIEEAVTSSRTPIIKLRHRSTEMNCDVSFKNGLSVENTRLLKCFIDNYPLCRKLMLFIKKWLFFCNLSGSQYITNYAICWYVIFYLQSKSILPSVASMIARKNESKIIDGWETGICETFDKCQEEFTFTELLHGFFVFYSSFDYRYSVACPILGTTIPKRDFAELHLLPKEMEPYINRIKKNGSKDPVELFRIDSEMCIQDPYDLSHNLTKAVRKFTLNRFKRLCAASAELLIDFEKH